MITYHPVWHGVVGLLLRFKLEDRGSQFPLLVKHSCGPKETQRQPARELFLWKGFSNVFLKPQSQHPAFSQVWFLVPSASTLSTQWVCSQLWPQCPRLPGIPAVQGQCWLRSSDSSLPRLGEEYIRARPCFSLVWLLFSPSSCDAAASRQSCRCITWVRVAVVHPGLCFWPLTLHTSQGDRVPSNSLYFPYLSIFFPLGIKVV